MKYDKFFDELCDFFIKKIKKIEEEEDKENISNLDYVMVRTYSAGVFAGYLVKRDGREVLLKDARRIWYWDGAASLSQLATDGTSAPEKCKFPCEVASILLLEAIEILPISDKAKLSIKSVAIWSA